VEAWSPTAAPAEEKSPAERGVGDVAAGRGLGLWGSVDRECGRGLRPRCVHGERAGEEELAAAESEGDAEPAAETEANICCPGRGDRASVLLPLWSPSISTERTQNTRNSRAQWEGGEVLCRGRHWGRAGEASGRRHRWGISSSRVKENMNENSRKRL
jgi:hypothetical protein